MAPIIGLALVFLAWLYQLYFTVQGNKQLKPFFALAYAAGLAFLIYDGLMSGANALALLNLLVAVTALIVFWKSWKG